MPMATFDRNMEPIMRRIAVLLVALVPLAILAQPAGIEKGKIKKIDADKLSLTLTVGGKDREVNLTDDTRVFGAEGKSLKERIKTLKVGTEVFFKTATKKGKTVLVGIKPTAGGARGQAP